MAPYPSVLGRNLFAPSLQTSKAVVTTLVIAGFTQGVMRTPSQVNALGNLVWLGKFCLCDFARGMCCFAILYCNAHDNLRRVCETVRVQPLTVQSTYTTTLRARVAGRRFLAVKKLLQCLPGPRAKSLLHQVQVCSHRRLSSRAQAR